MRPEPQDKFYQHYVARGVTKSGMSIPKKHDLLAIEEQMDRQQINERVNLYYFHYNNGQNIT